MIPDRNRDKIQAEAYRELAQLVEQSQSWAVPTHISQLIQRTDKKLGVNAFDVHSIMHHLWVSRRHRLPDTDFAYWPRYQHPKIRQQNDSEVYLQEQYFMATLKLDSNLLSRLEELEASLFSPAEGRMVVFWRSTFPIGIWEVLQSQELDSLTFGLKYCTAYIFDGEARTEARSGLPVYNLNIHEDYKKVFGKYPPDRR